MMETFLNLTTVCHLYTLVSLNTGHLYMSRARIHWQQSISAEEAEASLVLRRSTFRCGLLELKR